jgi:hypothetical protein
LAGYPTTVDEDEAMVMSFVFFMSLFLDHSMDLLNGIPLLWSLPVGRWQFGTKEGSCY